MDYLGIGEITFRLQVFKNCRKNAASTAGGRCCYKSASTLALLATADAPALDVVYETVSASATVGLSRNLTANLNITGKFIIIVTMYFGRVGPISLAVALGSQSESQNVVSDPTEEICIG